MYHFINKPRHIRSFAFLLLVLFLSTSAFAENEVVKDEAIENECYETLKPGATFTSTWSVGERDSGTLGFVVEKVDPEIDEVKGKLYEPASPRKTRPFEAVLQFSKEDGVVMSLKSEPENGLIDKRCTTSTARQFLRKGNRFGLQLKLEDGHWISVSDNIALDFRSRGIGNYAKRLKAYNEARRELETKILEAVKPGTVYSGTWTDADGKTGNISLQFGTDPTIDDEYHLVGTLFDMEEPHKSKPFTGAVALGEDSKFHFSIKTPYKKGMPRNILKTESQRIFLGDSAEYDAAFVLSDDGIDGETNGRFKLALQHVSPKKFKEKREALKAKDEARRAAIVDAVKPGTVYVGTWTDRDGKSGEVGFRFETLSDEGYAITGEVYDPAVPESRKPFEGQLSLGPDSTWAIEFKSPYGKGAAKTMCKTETAMIFTFNSRSYGVGLSLSENGLSGEGGDCKLELKKR